MKTKTTCLSFVLMLLAGCASPPPPATPSAETPRRIVSLVPSLTETLFALGQGDRVVAGTPYDVYPPEARRLPRVGSLFDANFEAIVALHPDLVLLSPYHQDASKQFQELGLRTLEVPQDDVEDIFASIALLGRTLGCQSAAAELEHKLRAHLARIEALVANRPKPRALITWGGGLAAKDASGIYVAGTNNFHNTMLELAGGTNAYKGPKQRNVVITREGLIALDPDVILDLIPPEPGAKPPENVKAAWKQVSELRAVRTNRVAFLEGDYVMMPGPRFVQTVEDMARALHPEAPWPPR